MLKHNLKITECLCYPPPPFPSFPDTLGDTHRECGRTSSVQKKGGRKEVQLEPWQYVGMTDSVLAWQPLMFVCAGHVTI